MGFNVASYLPFEIEGRLSAASASLLGSHHLSLLQKMLSEGYCGRELASRALFVMGSFVVVARPKTSNRPEKVLYLLESRSNR